LIVQATGVPRQRSVSAGSAESAYRVDAKGWGWGLGLAAMKSLYICA
jgi:hypothetical protein